MPAHSAQVADDVLNQLSTQALASSDSTQGFGFEFRDGRVVQFVHLNIIGGPVAPIVFSVRIWM